MNKKITLSIAIIILLAGTAGAGVWYNMSKLKTAVPEPAAPADNYSGSTVFSEPTEIPPVQTDGWLAYSDAKTGFSFKYPEKFGAEIWHPLQWPPAVAIVSAGQDPISAGCPKLNFEDGKPVGSKGTTANGTELTLYMASDVGAGQLYSEYCYVLESGAGYSAVIDFAIQSPAGCGFGGCGAYCGTDREEICRNLNRRTEIGATIMRIIETASFANQK